MIRLEIGVSEQTSLRSFQAKRKVKGPLVKAEPKSGNPELGARLSARYLNQLKLSKKSQQNVRGSDRTMPVVKLFFR